MSSITRDNASSNDTLISYFKSNYKELNLDFEGDIHCVAHVLNLVAQDIIKAIIKDDFNDISDVYNVENNNDIDIDFSSKFNI
jgi:formyltetrahydrofolate synthetase